MNRVWTHIRATVAFLGAPLIALVIASIAVMFLANEHPFGRAAFCRVGACLYSDAATGWNKLFYDFAAGCAITVVFYWLLVRMPEQRKRERIKKSLTAQYRNFKLACIENFLAVADGGFASAAAKHLNC